MAIDWETVISEQPALGMVPTRLREVARQRPFAKGETLFRQGQRPEVMLCVLMGEVRLVRHSIGGTEIILQRSSGGFMAEASLDVQAYHCDAVAAADGRLLCFPITAFRAALANDPAFNQAWITHLSREVRRLRAQGERLSLNSAAERVLHYIETEGHAGAVTLTQSRKAWAAELGLSHEALYRTLRRLQERGVLVIDGERIQRADEGRNHDPCK
jgi:CRP-like cAMP-binding protein